MGGHVSRVPAEEGEAGLGRLCGSHRGFREGGVFGAHMRLWVHMGSSRWRGGSGVETGRACGRGLEEWRRQPIVLMALPTLPRGSRGRQSGESSAGRRRMGLGVEHSSAVYSPARAQCSPSPPAARRIAAISVGVGGRRARGGGRASSGEVQCAASISGSRRSSATVCISCDTRASW